MDERLTIHCELLLVTLLWSFDEIPNLLLYGSRVYVWILPVELLDADETRVELFEVVGGRSRSREEGDLFGSSTVRSENKKSESA